MINYIIGIFLFVIILSMSICLLCLIEYIVKDEISIYEYKKELEKIIKKNLNDK